MRARDVKSYNKPLIIDIFSGAGGLSLGAARAGFTIAGAVEIDRHAIETHQRNFLQTKHLDKDVTTLRGRLLLERVGLKPGALDGIIGGPPCQGFSYIGRNKKNDPRNSLFHHFFRIVAELQPKFFLAENVPGILSDKFRNVRLKALGQVLNDYTILEPIKVIANEYGAATKRTRIFFIGYKSRFFDSLSVKSFAPPKNIEPVFVRNALKGLPSEIDSRWATEDDGWRPFKIGNTPYLRSITGRIPKGIGDPNAIDRYYDEGKVSGCLGTEHEKKVIRRFEALAPGEQDPISRATKLDPWDFCPTLRAGTGSDKGSYQAIRPIHYKQPRVITPREAARLQGFPDWFVFHRTKWHSFRQIGNSVSPIVAEKLLQVIASHLS